MPPRKTANRRRKSYQKGGFQKTRNTRKHMKPSITVGLIYANWCSHCQALKPEWKNMKKGKRTVGSRTKKGSQIKIDSDNVVWWIRSVRIRTILSSLI